MITINDTTPEAYRTIIEMLQAEDVTSSRAGDTREILNVSVVSENPRERYLLRDDAWNTAFQLQEHFAYWNGLNPGHVDRYVDMSQWLDDDGKLPGSAYGDRMRNTSGHDQIERVIKQLRDNPETRRAIVQVHQASTEDYSGSDVSCTESLQFFMRNGRLHLTAVLRSQDMYYGYCYDAANNQYLQELIAGVLQCDVGTYTHVMKSCHYYTKHDDEVDASLGSYDVEALPDMRQSAAELSQTMSRLEEALGAARDGELALEVIDMTDEPYDDWAMFMTAYELNRFHDEPTRARNVAKQIGVGWMRRWMLARF